MKKPVIVVNRHTPYVVEVFSRIGDVIALDTSEVTREALRDAEILIVRSETKVNAALLDGSRVKFVGTVTIGTDHIDVEYLRSNGIAFASAPGSNANSVAEYVAAALLTWGARTGQTLRGRTIGIVGVGNVGLRVIKIAEALGMNVLLNDPPLARATGDAKFLPLNELMEADFVTLHVPLTRTGEDATYHLFDEARLTTIKRGSVLINTSRGSVVETKALRAALATGQVSSAILDVWEGEPDIDFDLLNRVMLGSAHIAGYSLDGKLNALHLIYESACALLELSPEWNIDANVPLASSCVTVPEEFAKEQEVIHAAISQSYDIELDDAFLREMTTLPERERSRHFTRLREAYRIRREFFNREVELLPHQVSALEALRKLGFKTTVKEEVRL
jgi:erythronate-4-phosphate dehydrogenase